MRALALVLLVLVAACGPNRTGRPAPSSATANLIVENDTSESEYDTKTITVYVDRFEVGSVPPHQQRSFSIEPGQRKVEYRYSNDLNPRVTVGTFFFGVGSALVLDESGSVVK